MSKNFQTTQYEQPIGEDGEKKVKIQDREKNIGIKRIHIEEDPAKIKHAGGDISDSDYTKIDYNRSGTPLIEIVTDPDFESPEEARAYLQQLSKMLEYLGLYSPDSDYSIKSDANISIEGGSRVEVKNITGTSEVQKALSYEISRQKQLRKRGRDIEQQTRSFNSDMGATETLRQKETESDYGYIYEPDLTSQELDEDMQRRILESLPELPQEKIERLRDEYSISDKLVESLISVPQMSDDFEKLVERSDTKPETAASWITGELKKTLNYQETSYSEVNMKAGDEDYLLNVMDTALEKLSEDEFSEKGTEEFIQDCVENAVKQDLELHREYDIERHVSLDEYMKADEGEISEFVDSAIEKNPDAVDDYKSGKEKALNHLVGQVMQASKGKADAKKARQEIVERVSS
jgi:glutamyl-tRNA(Gln) and/or aspartyl-tRNA(Asn) amidotransferase, B subunit